jgi:hypothetical protein
MTRTYPIDLAHLPGDLLRDIETPADARKWLTALVREGLDYHPDDPADTVGHVSGVGPFGADRATDRHWVRTFADDAARALDRRMRATRDLLTEADIYRTLEEADRT